MSVRTMKPRWLIAVVGAVLSVGVGAEASRGADPENPTPRRALGKLASPTASLVRREAPGKPWKVVAQKDDVFADDLLLAVPSAIIDLNTGVRLEMMADFERRSPFPVIESAVVLHDDPKTDMSFTLDRGRVALSNRKEEGKASVDVSFVDQKWELQMPTSGCRTAVELYGRWPRGAVFTKTPTEKDVPHLDLILVVLDGEVALKTDCRHYLLKAPPGNALIEWDSIAGCDARTTRLEKRPAWADPLDFNATPERRLARLRMQRFRKLAQENSIEEALVTFLNSDDPNERRLAIYGLAATDQLDKIGDAVMKTPHEDVWDHAVLALRHWLGRGPGQDQKFYRFLTDHACAPGHAEIILQLTRGFNDEDLASPECYEMLIDYLKHDKQAIRGLAQWHLRRLVPAGRDLQCNPAAGPEEWEKTFQAWKKLIPDGKMPPKVTPEN